MCLPEHMAEAQISGTIRVVVIIGLLLAVIVAAVNGKKSSAPFQFEEEDAKLTVVSLSFVITCLHFKESH